MAASLQLQTSFSNSLRCVAPTTQHQSTSLSDPCSKIPKSWGLTEQNNYIALTRPTQYKSGLAEQDWVFLVNLEYKIIYHWE